MFDNDLTQAELAELLGCTQSQIARMYIRNKTSDRLTHKIEKLLNMKQVEPIANQKPLKIKTKQTFKIEKCD